MTLARCRELELEPQVSRQHLGARHSVYSYCRQTRRMQHRSLHRRPLRDNPALFPIRHRSPRHSGRPGHINLYAQDRGVLQRTGHTEAGVDLARLAGLQPVAALMEIMRYDDGSMARLRNCADADEWGVKLISIRDLVAYRLQNDSLVEQGEEVSMPTFYGDFPPHSVPPERQRSGACGSDQG